jgi:uncharacterized protein (TIGR00725 family)
MLRLDRARGLLLDGAGRRLDPARRAWAPAAPGPVDAAPIGAGDAVRWLQRDSGHPWRVPVGVIGPRQASDVQLATAEAVGAALGALGLTIVCGGREGVMEAACRGAARAGGLSIGLLPDADPAHANPFVTVPLATGIGEARNALIARAASCLVAIGQSHGTLSEIALGLTFGKPVFGLAGAAEVPGLRHLQSVDDLVDAVAALALAVAP